MRFDSTDGRLCLYGVAWNMASKLFGDLPHTLFWYHTVSPVENILNVNSSILLDVSRDLSRKIPPKKGLKNRLIIPSENPISLIAKRVEVSGCSNRLSRVPEVVLRRNLEIRILSFNVPIGENTVLSAENGYRHGSVIRWNFPSNQINAPG